MNHCRRCSAPTNLSAWRGVVLCYPCSEQTRDLFDGYRRLVYKMLGIPFEMACLCDGGEHGSLRCPIHESEVRP